MVKSSPSASISISDGHIAKTVLMPGDPLRAKYVAENYLDDVVCFNTVRNMLGFTGTYKGKEVSVMGHGMGVPSMTIYAYELYTFFEVENIIRMGSAGAIADGVKLRDVVIAMSASTDSNYGSQIDIPGTIAPTASYELLEKAVNAAKGLGVHTKVGSVYTSDFFYHPRPDINERLRDAGMLCVEMEAAGLYLTAMTCHKSALALFTISDDIFAEKHLSAEERQESFRDMMEVALETATR